MNTLSIKTVDGNRYDFEVPEDYVLNIKTFRQEWMEIDQHGVKRMFYIPNIVCITIREADDIKNIHIPPVLVTKG